MYVVKGLLTPEVGALLMRAIEAASDALFRSAKDDCEDTEPGQRRADALGLVAERALAAGFGGEDAPISGSRAERYQVLVHVEAESLTEEGEPGMSELEVGTRLSAESSRRLSCDASCVEVTEGPHGSVLDVGRRARTVPPAVRRALEVRDRGCRFPGCGLRFTDAHHVVHWADGGDTSLRNLLLLCARHHRAVHEGGFRVCLDAEAKAVFFSPHGAVVASTPAMADVGADPLGALIGANREREVEPDWRSGMPTCRCDHEVPWEIEALARESLERDPQAATTAEDVA
jgi:hypothetical protein